MADQTNIDIQKREIIPTHEVMSEYANTCIELLIKAGFELKDFRKVDHIAIRVPHGEKESYSYFNDANEELGEIAEFHSQAMINGRIIVIHTLNEAVETQLGSFKHFELPAPRVGRDSVEDIGIGEIDHIEIVLAEGQTLFTFFNDNHDLIISIADEERMIEIDKNVRADQNGALNPDVTLDLYNQEGKRFRVKFHTKSLEEVIAIERAMNEKGEV